MAVATGRRRATKVAGAAPAARAAREMAAQADAAAELLKALANPQRLRILCLLHERELSVGEINAQVDLSQSALSQHLAVLRGKGLVRTRRQAQAIHYSLAPGPAQDIIRALHRVYCTAPAAAAVRRSRAPRIE